MKKILIIDDEFIFRQGLRYMFDWEDCGYTIVGEVSNGLEGLEAVKDLAPDAVLCDVVMPVMDGVEFARRIKNSGGPPVIMLSNYDEFDKVRKAFQYGAADYILKNKVTKEELLKCLDRLASPQEPAGGHRPSRDFGTLARQALDGYAKEPYEELSSYIKSRIAERAFCPLYVSAPRKDFRDERHFHETVEAALPGRGLLSAFTSQNHGIALIGLSGEGDMDWREGFLALLSEDAAHTSVVLGTPFEELSSFRKKFETLHELSRFSILFEKKRAFYEPELTGCPREPVPFPSEIYARCSGQGQWAEARQILLEYLEGFKNRAAVSPYKLKSMIEHTMYSTLNDARRFAKSQGELNRAELRLFKQMDSAVGYTDIYEALSCAFESLALICPVPRSAVTPVIDAFFHFLEENYDRQITLYDAAEHLHMNYSYLSACISQNTDRHFSEHLNEVRIEHAKKLLENPDVSISAVSTSIGYADQSYFGKMFKKLVGVTPLQYRNARAGKRESHAKA